MSTKLTVIIILIAVICVTIIAVVLGVTLSSTTRTPSSNGYAFKASSVPPILYPDDVEFVGPFSSWVNVKVDAGAKGDGIADDTSAIQSVLDIFRVNSSTSLVLYFPPGIYKISDTLNLTGVNGGSLIGSHPEEVTIKWAGIPSDIVNDGVFSHPMVVVDGGIMTRFCRITWDGMGIAAVGIAHYWNITSGRFYGGSMEHTDSIFRNFGVGIQIGRLGSDFGSGDSEGQFKRLICEL